MPRHLSLPLALAALKPGVYFLLVTQDGASETARVGVIR